MLSLTVLISFVGGLLIKAAYAQYYLLWFPLAAVVAADWLARLAAPTRNGPLSLWERVRVRALLVILVLLLLVEAVLAARAIGRGADGPLPHLAGLLSTLSLALLAGTILAALAAAAGTCIWRGRWAGAVMWLALLGLGYADLRNLDALCWSSRNQVAAIRARSAGWSGRRKRCSTVTRVWASSGVTLITIGGSIRTP